MEGKYYHRFISLSPKWPSLNNKFDNCQFFYSVHEVRCCSSAWIEYRVRNTHTHTHTHEHFKCVHRSIESFISLDNHMLNVCIVYASLGDEPVEIKSGTSKQIKTKQTRKTNQRTEQFQCRSTLECHRILLCAWERERKRCMCVCIAACAHHSMQTHQTRNANVALFQSGLLWTIYGCNKLFVYS